jgi:Fe-S-cluster-containing dehydrogenase component
MDSCPVNAIRKNEQGLVEIVSEECTGCANCVGACPAGAIKIHPELGKAFKCDLCGGRPNCVDYCPNNAIDYRDVPFDTRAYAKKAEDIAKSLRKGLFGLEG